MESNEEGKDTVYKEGFEKELHVTLKVIGYHVDEFDSVIAGWKVSFGENLDDLIFNQAYLVDGCVIVDKESLAGFIEREDPQYKINKINLQIEELQKQKEEVSKYV